VRCTQDVRSAGSPSNHPRRPPTSETWSVGAAGNTAGSTRAFTVRLRYIDLFKHTFKPHGRILRVRVSTDAKTVGWRLGPTRGNAKPPLIRLPVPSKPGRYTLTVRANGHTARATVVVRK